jgi:hypothetical protein
MAETVTVQKPEVPRYKYGVCPDCEKEFEMGDIIVYRVDSVGRWTFGVQPTHSDCRNPKKKSV